MFRNVIVSYACTLTTGGYCGDFWIVRFRSMQKLPTEIFQVRKNKRISKLKLYICNCEFAREARVWQGKQ